LKKWLQALSAGGILHKQCYASKSAPTLFSGVSCALETYDKTWYIDIPIASAGHHPAQALLQSEKLNPENWTGRRSLCED
jgi:hypothetical protein